MANKMHWFPFYYLDWLSDSDVSMMTYSEKGLYIDMLCRCFNDDGLPNDDSRLLRIFKCSTEDLDECKKRFYENGEKLLNKKLQGIKKDQKKISKGRSKAGKASAQARKRKRLTQQTNDEQMLKSVETKPQQNSTNTTQHNTVQHNTDNNNKKTKAKKFIPPTVNDVSEYCKLRKNNIDPVHFVTYYEARGWMLKSVKMKNWKAAIVTWEKNNENKPEGRKNY